MKRWTAFVLVLLVCMFWAQCAYALNHAVDAYAVNGAGGNVLSAGTYAKQYIYPKPTLAPWTGNIATSGGHVNSIYAMTQTGKGVEVGWVWQDWMSGTPQIFSVFFDPATNAYVLKSAPFASIPIATDTWVRFKLDNITGTDDWSVKIEETQYMRWYNTGITSSYARVASERQFTQDDGRGSWTYETYRPWGTSSWSYWSYALNRTDSDDDYGLYTGSIGNPNRWIYVNLD